MIDADNNATITFAPALAGQTISLTSGEIEIELNLTIDSSNLPAGVSISGSGISRIFNVIIGRRLNLSSLTLTENSAPSSKGGGIASYGLADTQTVVTNSIIAGNLPSNTDLVGGSFNSFQNFGTNLIATNALPISPRLAPLGNYGGPTRTMPPLPGSPAIDAATSLLTNTAQRGFTRDGSSIQILDTAPSQPRAFYRFETELIER